MSGRTVTRFDKLPMSWPEYRPTFINFMVDYETKTVFITDARGKKMLAVPFDRWSAVADEIGDAA